MHCVERLHVLTILYFSVTLILFCCLDSALGNEDLQLQWTNATAWAAAAPSTARGGDCDEGVPYKLYFVYVRDRARAANRTSTASGHLHLLREALGISADEAQKSLIYSYTHAFNGFAATLREDHVKTLAGMREVVRIVLSRTLQLFTTNSWNFLGLPTNEATDIGVMNPSIIGVIDTGVWPGLPSFEDDGIGQIPARWRGGCQHGGTGFPVSHCNRKLIGVRYYNAGWAATNRRLPNEPANALDRNSHGTHVASTAGGHVVKEVKVLDGLVNGTARGGNHMGRLAVYKVYWESEFSEADVVAAMDDAINDGVDIINLSLGSRPEAVYSQNPIAIASFHAMQAGILTVCAAGNAGPAPSTITNTAPWILTVTATTTNRDVVTSIRLDNQAHLLLPGFSIFLTDMTREWYDLVPGANIRAVNSPAGIDNARHCRLGSLDAATANGRIVFCNHLLYNPNEPSIGAKCSYAQQIKAAGVIIVNDAQLHSNENIWPPFFPCTVVSSSVGLQISNYISSTATRQPRAKILRTRVVFNEQPAPAVAGFSSRGPNTITHNLLKPDIAAPGVDILAGYSPLSNNNLYQQYGLMSGTSMAAPHVSAVASLVRAYNGFINTWSPAALKSAIMTTAIPISRTDGGTEAYPFDSGSGCLRPLSAIKQPGPGLIYNADVNEYIKFLCNMGYSESTITSVFLRPPKTADCRGESDIDLISQINLPSIAIAELRGSPMNVRRTVTNMGAAHSTYRPTIVQPPGVVVTVRPEVLQFSTSETRLTYTLHFLRSAPGPVGASVFGSITWSDGTHRVYSPIAIHSISGSLTMEDVVAENNDKAITSAQVSCSNPGIDSQYNWEL